MNHLHLESALAILRSHATERPYCEATKRLIALTELRLKQLAPKGPNA